MNTVQKPWKLINYIEAYANEGRIEYVKLLELINTKDYYQSVAIISQVAVNSISPRGMVAPIQNGDFKFYNYEKTVEFLAFLQLFKEKQEFHTAQICQERYINYFNIKKSIWIY